MKKREDPVRAHLRGFAFMLRRFKDHMRELDARCDRCEQAILELAETLRRAGIADEDVVLPSDSEAVPDLQSADERRPRLFVSDPPGPLGSPVTYREADPEPKIPA